MPSQYIFHLLNLKRVSYQLHKQRKCLALLELTQIYFCINPCTSIHRRTCIMHKRPHRKFLCFQIINMYQLDRNYILLLCSLVRSRNTCENVGVLAFWIAGFSIARHFIIGASCRREFSWLKTYIIRENYNIISWTIGDTCTVTFEE